jgi:fructokinase
MRKLISIGEALIDFIPNQKGVSLKDVTGFTRVAGGAPANVSACVSTLGKKSMMLTKLGNDAFGDYIIDVLKNALVDTSYIQRTNKANTGLAFVSLKEDGNRDFSFYRNPSADMLLQPSEISEDLFDQGDILHFCSVDLIDAPVKKAHDVALEIAKRKQCIISFDPNVRLPLWDDHDLYKKVINEYIPHADIIKVSDEELEYITGTNDINDAINNLFVGNVKVVIYTKGAHGVEVFTKESKYQHLGFTINAIDTTGAGDAFIGAFIYQLLENNIGLKDLSKTNYDSLIEFANAVGAIVASKKGAISSMPSLEVVSEFLKTNISNSR